MVRDSSLQVASDTSGAVEQPRGLWRRFVDFWVARFERLLGARRGFFEHLQIGNRARALRPAGDMQIQDGRWVSVGADPQLTLPGASYKPGYYALIVHVVGPQRRGYAKLYVDEGGGYNEERTFGLVTKQERSVFRIVHFKEPPRALRFDPGDEPGPVAVPLFRLHRVTRRFAWRRMLRRLGLEHALLAGRGRAALEQAIASFAEQRNLTSDLALQRLYDETFGQRSRRGDYAAWQALVEAPSVTELLALPPPAPATSPKLSILVPTYNTRVEHLEACLKSVLQQGYPNWQLCIVDDASTSHQVREVLTRWAAQDARVLVHFRPKTGHICHATNDALALATGGYVALLDHDDLLAPHALLRAVHAIAENADAGLFYGDEDKLGQDGVRKAPHFKSQFNPELLLAQSYMGHLIVARTSEVRAVGGFRPGYEGSQDHDLLLRLTERLKPAQIVHIPHILYHWRESEGSTALHVGAKSYTAEAGLRAVTDALARRQENATADHAPLIPHGYRVSWNLPAKPPLVSLLIPTRDAHALLRMSVGSILEKTSYPHFEVLILDNGSVQPETFAYFDELKRDPRVRIVRDDSPFNFSALNNRGVRESQGEVVGLINNDIEVIDGDWLTEMVSLALRPAVGCVGAKLLYPDGTIQHAGVITGVGGVAGHAHKKFPGDDPGYFSRLRLTHALSAVTAACLVVRRSVLDQVGGLDETLAVAFNDVDFCLKVREAGYRNLFTPYATLYHHESATRGRDTSESDQRRFRREANIMKARWGHLLRQDPYYSPHLSLEHEDFSIGLRG